VSSCITIWKREHANKFTRWCHPLVGKTPAVGAPGRGPACFSLISHSFPDGHSHFADSALHGDLVWESRVHVYWLRLRRDLALDQRTRRSPRRASTIEGPETSSPSRFPAQEEVWSAPSSLFYLVTTDGSCQAGGDTGVDSTVRRSREYDGSAPRGSRDDRRWRALRALPHRLATSARAVHPKKSIVVQPGQCRDVARQDNMSKRPDVRGKSNCPPTRQWSTATGVRAT